MNTLRSLLREYYPAALAAFGTDLAGRDALAVLTAVPGHPDALVFSALAADTPTDIRPGRAVLQVVPPGSGQSGL